MHPKTRAQRRKTDASKARRKKRIAGAVYYSWSSDAWEYYDNLHQYSKNKIHCSCPMCREKTRDKVGLASGKKYNPPIRDLRRTGTEKPGR